MKWLPNVIGFQIVWMAAVGGAAQGWWWAGPAALALFALVQLALSHSRQSDLLLMLLCAVLGFAIDSAWIALDLMHFVTPWPWPSLAPIWIVAMWMGFALTLNHSLSSLKKLPAAAALLGVLGGPLAYFAAERAWQAVELQASAMPYIALAIGWGVITPLLLWIAERTRCHYALPTVSSA